MNLKLTVAYDGTRFRGWARQPGERTVESVLGASLARVFESVGTLVVAGRTDAGVHALANVASVVVDGGPPAARAARALNATLPADLSVVGAAAVAREFHARFSATSRSYRYRIWRSDTRSPFEIGRSYWHPARLDLDGLAACAELLPGEHDFRAFTPTDTQHEVFVRRILSAHWRTTGSLVEFEVTADSFLRHMVRTLVGTMLVRSPEQFSELLAGAHRSAAGATAAAYGLYLVGVSFDTDPAHAGFPRTTVAGDPPATAG